MASLPVAFGSESDVGRVRTSNEDSLCVQPLSAGGLRLLVAVADGMGGAAAGDAQLPQENRGAVPAGRRAENGVPVLPATTLGVAVVEGNPLAIAQASPIRWSE